MSVVICLYTESVDFFSVIKVFEVITTMTKLSEFYVTLAKNELGEDELKKAQALSQFRDYIDKHPAISNANISDIELLAFLRTSKFSMIECYKRFNNFLKLMAKFPQWFDRDEKAMKSAMDLYESGYLVPLPERDADGRRILLIRASKIDETKYVANDIIRLIYDVLFYSMEEEETSITGYVILVDYTGITLKQSTLLSFLDYKALNESAHNANPGRHKKLILFNLPTYVNTLADMIKMTFSIKLRKRLFLLEESQLKDHIDVKYLPKEYGGTVSLKECLHEFTEFKRTFEENRNNWYDLKIDANLIPGVKNVDHGIGSFRKLNID